MSRPAAPAVALRQVSKLFDGHAAVDDASFTLEKGQFLTILGPSGCGKTTLLRMIAGFIQPTSGEIEIEGRPVSAVPPHRRAIGMVFQKLALFPHMTAAQNIAYPLKMRRFDPKSIPGLVEKYLDVVRLGGHGDRRIFELSGGQQQRVAIARALSFSPDLLLLDEPLSALDRKLREEMQLEFRRIQQALGVTTINVTHDQREALVMSDSIVVMDKGRIQQSGPPIGLYRRPSNRFVAGFIGLTSFLEGRIESAGEDHAVLRVGNHLLTGRAAEHPAVGSVFEGAIRAEQVRIRPLEAMEPDLDCELEAEVIQHIFEGDRMVYELALTGLGGQRLYAFDHDPADHRIHEPGSRVKAGWNNRDLLLFPKAG